MAAPGSPAPVGERTRTVAAVAVAVAAGALVACASPRGERIALPDIGEGGAGAGSCRLADGTEEVARRPDTLRIGAAGPLKGVRPPVALAPSERIAYRHLYATLVEVDCRGRIRPGLASAWTRGEDGRRWTFRLRDGTSPEAVVEAWRRRGVLDPAGDSAPGHPLIRSAAGEDDSGRLTVVLARPFSAPAPLAELRYAVTVDAGTGSRRDASGPYRLVGRTDAGREPGAGKTWTLRPRASDAPVLRITAFAGETASPGPGARDLLDGGVDVLLARGAGTRRYAASLPGYRLHALPWDRTYVLLVPGSRAPAWGETGVAGGPGAASEQDVSRVPGGQSGADREAGLLADLAEDAVEVEARASRPPYWWAGRCAGRERAPGHARPPPGGDSRPPPGADGVDGDEAGDDARPFPRASVPRLVYPAGDGVAGDLAARLAALQGTYGVRDTGKGGLTEALDAAAGAGPGPLRAVGLPEARFRDALRGGDEAGYVLPLRRRSLAPCRDRDAFLRRVPWHEPGPGRIVPLVETRPFVAVRGWVTGVELGWDGTPLIPPRPAADRAGRRP